MDNLREAINLYHSYYEKNKIWEGTRWLGQPMWKLPADAIILQEIIFDTKPQLIVETGTGMGGSALYYASVLHLMGGCGEVLTIDIDRRFVSFGPSLVSARIKFIKGSSLSDDVLEQVRSACARRGVMVILDSWHSYDHVREELDKYSQLVSVGNYMVVEDSHVSGHPVEWEWGKGPYEAVQDFLSKCDGRFEIDRRAERHLMTFNPSGYLRRVK